MCHTSAVFAIDALQHTRNAVRQHHTLWFIVQIVAWDAEKSYKWGHSSPTGDWHWAMHCSKHFTSTVKEELGSTWMYTPWKSKDSKGKSESSS